MRSRIWLVLTFVSLSFLDGNCAVFPFSQNNSQDLGIDSLLILIAQNPKESGPDVLFQYGYEALSKARQSGNPKYLGDAHSSLAQLHRTYTYLYDSNLYHSEEAIPHYEEIGDLFNIANCRINMGYSYLNKVSFLSAEEQIMEAIDIYTELGNQSEISRAYQLLAYSYYLSGSYKEAINYGEQSYQTALLAQDTLHVIDALTYLIPAYVESDQVSVAMTKANECLEWIESMDEIDLFKIMDLYHYRGSVFEAQNRLDEAMKDYTESWELAKVYFKGSDAATFYTFGIGRILQLKGDYEGAIETNQRLLDHLYEAKEFENLVETHIQLAESYESIGDYKQSLIQKELAWNLQDSLKSLRTNALTSELQIRYETARREEQILTQQNQISRQQRFQYLIIGIASLLLIAFSAIFIFYRRNQRKNKRLEELNESLQEKNLQLDERSEQNELLVKEIHHRVKNNLELVSSLLELQSAQLANRDQQKALRSSQMRIQSMSIIHQKLYRDKTLSTIEMKDYFENLGRQLLDSYNVSDRISLTCGMERIELDLDTAIPIGLIVNEILSNALKYAFPDQRQGIIEITMTEADGDRFHLTISDDGVGKTSNPDSTGFGSQLIMLLTKQLGGSLREEVSNGTRIFLDLKKAHPKS